MIIDNNSGDDLKINLKIKTIDSNEYLVELSQGANIEELKKVIEHVNIIL